MRRLLAATLLVAFIATPAHAEDLPSDAWPPGHHAPSVAAFEWEPREPARGTDVRVDLTLQPDATPQRVHLVVCRAEAYSCLAPIELLPVVGADGGSYEATVPWSTFFRDARHVGLKVVLTHADGSQESSPDEPWPGTPAALPAEADVYYFYSLPPPVAGAPTGGVAVGILAAAVGAHAMGGRRR